MFCPNCGKTTPEASTFCLHCGRKIIFDYSQQTSVRKSSPPPTSSAKLLSLFGGLLIFVIGAVLLTGVIIENQRRQSLSSNGRNTSSSSLADIPRRLVAQRTPLTPPAFVVEPSRYSSWRFNVASGGRVVGSFRSDTNIVVGIFDAENFNLYQNDKSCRSYYSSGKIPSGNIDVSLPAGSYAIVFSNTYSFFSTKNITAEINLEQ